MWMVNNTTRYASDRSWLQDKEANKIWLVVIKGTFDILANGSTCPSEEQVPVLRMGQPRGEFGVSSLVYDADLLGVKPATDLIVNGRAWAPGGRPVRSVDVQASVGPIRKRLRVFGDRVWQRSAVGPMRISDPVPFTSVAIEYERAFGGWDRSARNPDDYRLDSRNPVGTGFIAARQSSDGVRLPNVEWPDRLITSSGDHPPPAGFGVIDWSWSPRRELAGTYDDNWRKNRFPLWAEDFDARYSNCAPSDQQIAGYLRGGEAVELINLSRDGVTRFRLPRIHPGFETRFGAEYVPHRGHLCTVIIEPESRRLILVWQASLTCNFRADDLDETIVTEKRLI